VTFFLVFPLRDVIFLMEILKYSCQELHNSCYFLTIFFIAPVLFSEQKDTIYQLYGMLEVERKKSAEAEEAHTVAIQSRDFWKKKYKDFVALVSENVRYQHKILSEAVEADAFFKDLANRSAAAMVKAVAEEGLAPLVPTSKE